MPYSFIVAAYAGARATGSNCHTAHAAWTSPLMGKEVRDASRDWRYLAAALKTLSPSRPQIKTGIFRSAAVSDG